MLLQQYKTLIRMHSIDTRDWVLLLSPLASVLSQGIIYVSDTSFACDCYLLESYILLAYKISLYLLIFTHSQMKDSLFK